MTDTARNTRTLIVCFSLAIFALIPLRFVEVGQQVPEATVLGETMEQPQVILPDADINPSADIDPLADINPSVDDSSYVLGQIETPNEEVSTDCMTGAQVDEAVTRINEGLTNGIYTDTAQADAEIQWLNAQLCQ